MEWSENDIEYVLEHLEEPESLVEEEFLQWLETKEHRELFETIRNQREAFLRKEDRGHIQVGNEYEYFIKQITPRRTVRYWSWGVAAASIVIAFMVFFRMNQEPSPAAGVVQSEILTGRKTAELILANGYCVELGRKTIELREENGTWITNDTNFLLAYRPTQPKASEKELVYNTIRVPAGADYIVRLSDGTKVHLNCESEFRFPVAFAGNERRVYLDGEAFFEVEKSGEWPFIVVTDKMNVKVTGTRFNVKSYKSDHVVATTLVSGAVEVQADKVVQLTPSQQFVLDKSTGSLEVNQVDVSLYTGWTEGMFVFKNQRLEEVMDVLSRWYSMEVSYKSASVKNLRLSANLGRYEYIDSLLEIIQAMDKVKIERRGKLIKVDWK